MRPITPLVEVHVRSAGLLCRLGLCSGLALLAGCELPAAPRWEVGLLVPFTAEEIAISDFLPSQVRDTVISGQPAFTIEAQVDSVGYSLAQACGDPCRALEGQIAQVPGFDYTDSLDVLFPNDLSSVEVVTSNLTFRLRNDFGFDPLRPDPDPNSAGYVAVVAKDLATGAVVDSVLLSGASDSLPSGTTRDLVLTVANVELSQGIRTVANIHSPFDGQTSAIDTALTVNLTTLLDQNVVLSVTAVLDAEQLDESFAVDIDGGARTGIFNDLQGGTFELELTHDLDVSGTLDVSIAGSPGDLFSGSPVAEVRLLSFDLSAAPTGRKASRDVTPGEIQFIAGLPEIHLGYRAMASGAGIDGLGRPTARLTPDQFIDARFKLTTRLAVDF